MRNEEVKRSKNRTKTKNTQLVEEQENKRNFVISSYSSKLNRINEHKP